MLKAIMFDLDDTLINRSKAADAMFLKIARECYANTATDKMRQSFKKYDNNGYSDKITVLNSLFDEYPPAYRIPSDEIYNFWNAHFPQCFSEDLEVHSLIKKITRNKKTAIITNGSTQTQKAKIKNAGLDKFFSTIIISEEAGVKKPEPQIFNLALRRLNIKPHEAIFIGDNLKKDIAGCQNAGIKGVWFNPERRINGTNITPFFEIRDLNEILKLPDNTGV